MAQYKDLQIDEKFEKTGKWFDESWDEYWERELLMEDGLSILQQ